MTKVPLLSIAIPTYNRSDCLDLLLTTVLEQVRNISAVEVLVLNNASTDDTNTVLAAHQSKSNPSLRVINNSVNLGLDGNVSSCFRFAEGQYVWIIGDDDLPTANAIRLLVDALLQHSPDVLFMRATSHEGDLNHLKGTETSELRPVRMDAEGLCRQASSLLTFLSSVVVSKRRFTDLSGGPAAGKYLGTSLSHMEWIFSLIQRGNRFFFISEPLIQARAGNTGGYRLFEVFGSTYSRIVTESLSKPLARTLLKNHAWIFLPGFIWQSRFGYIGKFDAEDILAKIGSPINNGLAYRLLLTPLAEFPKFAAAPIYLAARLIRRCYTVKCKIELKLSENKLNMS